MKHGIAAAIVGGLLGAAPAAASATSPGGAPAPAEAHAQVGEAAAADAEALVVEAAPADAEALVVESAPADAEAPVVEPAPADPAHTTATLAEPEETDPCAEYADARRPAWSRELWIDRFEKQLRKSGCYSALWIDQLVGPPENLGDYRAVSGNVGISLLWTEYDGFDPRVRFKIDLPLPQINESLRAFIGRTDRDEFVTERNEPAGFIPRQFGTIGDEQTLFGLGYRPPSAKDGSGFDYSAGVRIRSPLDPFVKVSYRMAWIDWGKTAVVFRPTVFWQQRESFGVTTRIDVPYVFSTDWLALLTASATWSERSQGMRSFANATLFRRLDERSAAALQVGLDGESDAEVPLREFGTRLIYRRNVWRDWLAMEVRTSVTWPRELRAEPREPSWGVGLGFELVFGEGAFRGF